MSLTFTDVFCGAGGSSVGLTEAGFELSLAANHWARAIETHSANFPDAEHLCADVSNYDMRRLPNTDVLWASPECVWHSPAGGRPRRSAQGELFDQRPPTDAEVRSRMTMLDVIRATEARRYLAVVVENVIEVAAWELWDWWLQGIRTLGYEHQIVCVSSAHIAGPHNPPAAQWRDRLYVVFTRQGIPAPDLEPRPRAWCDTCGHDIAAVQAWKRPDRPRIGRYGRQYLYRCPDCGDVVEPYVAPAASVIDWSNLGQRIGDRTRPLKPATLARIRAGLEMFTQPVTVAVAGGTFERAGAGYRRTWPALDAPLRTRTGTAGDAIATPVVVNVNHTGDDGRPYPPQTAPLGPRTTRIGDGLATPAFYIKNYGSHHEAGYRAWPITNPLGAVTTADSHGIVSAPFVTTLRNNSQPAEAASQPLATLATGRHQWLTVPPEAFYVKNYSGPPHHMAKPIAAPLGTVTGVDHHALVIPYRRGQARTTSQPLHTLATRDSAALCTIEVDVEDCHYRMLQPREHLRGQRIPDSYRITGTKTEQTAQAGNAVSVNVAHWIGTRLADALDGTHTTGHPNGSPARGPAPDQPVRSADSGVEEAANQ